MRKAGGSSLIASGKIASRILLMRGEKVILDADLAKLYGVPTFRFNEAVKRNRNRFPGDFVFQLTREEVAALISQNAMSKSGRGGEKNSPVCFYRTRCGYGGDCIKFTPCDRNEPICGEGVYPFEKFTFDT